MRMSNTPIRQRPSASVRDWPIGIFDSGIGGLTVVREIHRALPCEDLVYLGDTARVPYGTKSPAAVVRFACEDAEFLVRQKVKAIVVACNTASAWALPTLELQFGVPIFGVIAPGARAGLAMTRNGRIGVIGTPATIRSQAYPQMILKSDPSAKVVGRACPLLVPLVEEGWINHAVTKAVLGKYLRPLLRQRIDTLILGCTHYPLLRRAIQLTTGPTVRLVDSAQSCAKYVRERLQALALFTTTGRSEAALRTFVTDDVERFEAMATRFLGFPIEPPTRIDLAPSVALRQPGTKQPCQPP